MTNNHCTSFVFVGYGQIAKRHIRILGSKRNRLNISVVSNHASDADLKKAHGDNVFLVKPEQIFSDDSNTIIVITSPSSEHLNDVRRLKSNGLGAILVEKPIAKNSKQGSEILQILRSTGVPAFVLYNLRFSVGLETIKSLLDTEKYGSPLYVKAVVGQDLAQWRQQTSEIINTISARKETGGGVLRELSHELDYLSVIFDDLKIKLALLTNTKYDAMDVEDTAFLIMEASYKGKKMPISLVQDFVRPDKTRKFTVVCEHASLCWNLYSGRVEVHSTESLSELIFDDSEDLEKTYLNMWTRVLRNDYADLCTCDEAVKHLQLIENAESMQIDD